MCMLLIFIAATTVFKANKRRTKAAIDESLMKVCQNRLFEALSSAPYNFPMADPGSEDGLYQRYLQELRQRWGGKHSRNSCGYRWERIILLESGRNGSRNFRTLGRPLAIPEFPPLLPNSDASWIR
jgi:hypothetical protein